MAKILSFISALIFVAIPGIIYACSYEQINLIKGKSLEGDFVGKILVAGFEVGTARLSNITSHFNIPSSYDGEDASRIIYACVVADDGETEVHFQSGAMGGWDVVTSVVFSKSGFFSERKCTAITDSPANKWEGIALGDDISSVLDTLGGKLSYLDRDRVEVVYKKEIPPLGEQQYSGVRTTGFIGYIPRGHLEAFSIVNYDSY
jgi:hypothetical protein